MRHLFKQITRLALLALTAMLPQLASAYDFMVDGLAYNINSDGTSVTVTSGGNYIGAVNIPSTVTNNGITYSVTSIGERTFYICSSLTSVTIPNSVTSIGNFAFYECSNLTSVTIPNSVTSIGNYAFRGTGLTSVTIPKSVTSIGSLAFYNCNSLTSVNWNAISCADFTSVPFQTSSSKIKTFTFGSSVQIIPKLLCKGLTGLTSISLPTSVTEIRDYAFQGCTGLTSVSIPNSVTSIGDQAFEGCTSLTSVTWNAINYSDCDLWHSPLAQTQITSLFFGDDVEHIPAFLCNELTSLTTVTISNSVTSIGQSAFRNCSGLESVIIGNSVTEIGLSAFSGCSGLTSVTIPNSVTTIGSGAFRNCSGMTSVIIGSSVTEIGWFAFEYCTGLTSVTIPNSVTWIGDQAFEGCTSLTSMVVESGNTEFDSRNNCNAIIKTATNTLIRGCKNTVIPNSVTSIGQNAFGNCIGLTSVEIPNSVTEIHLSAFSGCSGLTSVTIPNSVTSIGVWAFRDCSDLTSVTLSNSLATIPGECFDGCSSLTSIEIPNSVTMIYWNAFSNCSGLTSIVVESGNPKYDSRNNCNAIIETMSNTIVLGCKNTIIPNSVTSIGRNAFGGCIGLTTVTIPSSVTSIVDIAFNGCTSLNKIYCLISEPITINENVFSNYNADLYVPAASVSKYNTKDPWMRFNVLADNLNTVTSIALDTEEKTLNVGESFTLTPTLLPETAVNKSVTWSSSDATVASVDTLGNVTALKRGTATIIATTNDGSDLSASCVVTVLQPVTGITVNEHNHTLKYNGSDTFSFKLTASTTPNNASNANVVWSSSNENIATVSSDGTVTSAGKGVASIIATTTDGTNLSDSCIVTVEQLVTEVTLEPQAKTLNVGESFTLASSVLPENANDKSVTWSSSDATVTSVDTLGKVTALKRGAATITATTNDGSDLSASCMVTVLQPVTGITVNEHNHTLKYNGSDTFSFKLTASTTPSNANTSAVQWTSSNENIATVSSDGTVTSAGKGVVTITATTTDGSNLSDSCIVTVEQLVTEITLDPQAKTLNVGESFTLSSSVLPENANDKSVTWSSSNTNVASVDTLGNVTALRRGSATITATTKDGSNINASSVVTVLQPVTGISLNENSYTLLYNGQQFYLFSLVATATPSNANNKNVTWTSSNESVAAVNNSGVVTSQGLGTAIITATTTDGSNLSDSCVVTVNPVPTTSISLDKAKEAVVMGNTVQITGTVDEAAYIKTFNWTSSNDAVASVDQNGLVRGVGVGTVSITATTIDGSNLSASCIVQVLYPSNAAGAGDVNEDGRIDITDATLIVSYLQGNYPMAVLDEALMDVNGDGDINMSDVLRVISLIRND